MSAPRSDRTEQFTHVAIGHGQVGLRLREAPITKTALVEDLSGLDVSIPAPGRVESNFQDQWSLPRQPYMHGLHEHIQTEADASRWLAMTR